MTKKERLEAIIKQLEAKNTDNKLDQEIADLKKEVEDLEDIKEIQEKLNQLTQHLPSEWKSKLINSSLILTPLLLISKIVWDYYQKYQTQQDLDEMMSKVKQNLKKK